MNDNKYTILDENGVSTLVSAVIKNFSSSKPYTELQSNMSDLNKEFKELLINIASDIKPCSCTISKIDTSVNQLGGVAIRFTADYPNGFNNRNTMAISSVLTTDVNNYTLPKFVTFEKALIKGFVIFPDDVSAINANSTLVLYLKKIP